MMKLQGIARRAVKKAAMEELDACEITTDKGVFGDVRGKPGKRQVTVLSEEAWHQACLESGAELRWTARRANLLVTGLEFDATFVGKIIQIGDVQLQVTIETAPCERMDKAHQGLRKALASHWRGGVCCRVKTAGRVRVGDLVTVIDG